MKGNAVFFVYRNSNSGIVVQIVNAMRKYASSTTRGNSYCDVDARKKLRTGVSHKNTLKFIYKMLPSSSSSRSCTFLPFHTDMHTCTCTHTHMHAHTHTHTLPVSHSSIHASRNPRYMY